MSSIWITILFASSVGAATDGDLQLRYKALREIGEAIEKAEDGMPAFDRIEYISQTVARFSPPKSCKKSTVIFDAQMELDRELRENMKVFFRVFETTTANFQYSREGYGMLCGLKSIMLESKRKFNEILDQSTVGDLLNDPQLELLDQNKDVEGEYANSVCALPAIIIPQFRKKQLGFMNKLYSFMDAGIDAACTSNRGEVETSINYLRFSEGAFDQR